MIFFNCIPFGQFHFKCMHARPTSLFQDSWRKLSKQLKWIYGPKDMDSSTISSDKFMAFCWMHHFLKCVVSLVDSDYRLQLSDKNAFLFPMKFTGKPEQLISVSTHMSIQVNRQFTAVYQLTDTNKSFVHCYRFLFRKCCFFFRFGFWSSWENWVAIKPIWNVITIIDWSLRANCCVEIRLGVDYSVCAASRRLKWRRGWLCIEWRAN